ncbi:hypothetical protein M231_03563 [Tremella mesenterica]|uniref:Uncharacterized protein n=1 Tax=Tremella mesenterica TaxID=5217 RepID=A0A4Q1BN00_TREME|nr:hypothetical protein M231_03563 [Tremella mesenterica]
MSRPPPLNRPESAPSINSHPSTLSFPRSATSTAPTPSPVPPALGSHPSTPTSSISNPIGSLNRSIGVNAASTSGPVNSDALTGTALRPSYALTSDRDREQQRDREQRERDRDPKPISFSNSLLSRTSDPSMSHHSHPHASAHHHHHHHHHVHPRPPGPSSTSTSTPGSDRPSPYSTTLPSARRDPPPVPGRTPGTRPPSASYAHLFGIPGFRDSPRESQRNTAPSQENRYSKPPSPKKEPAIIPSGPYAIQSNPTSPTASRAGQPPPGQATVTRPSVSPQMSTITPGSQPPPRPNLSLPSLSTLGSRSYPSSFDKDVRDRSASFTGADSGAHTHGRTLSGSSNRADREPLPGVPSLQASPGKGQGQSGLQTQSQTSSRNFFSGPPSLGLSARDRELQRSPLARTTAPPHREGERDPVISPTRPTVVPPPTATSNNTAPTSGVTSAPKPSVPGASPYSFSSTPYTSSSQYGPYPSYPGAGFGFTPYGWQDRERDRDIRQQERDREARERRELREQREADWRREIDREEKAAREDRIRKEAELRNREHQSVEKPVERSLVGVETKPFQPPRQPYTDRRYREQDYEVSALQQVAPQREPRPYVIKAEHPRETQKERELREREYNYQPRDSRDKRSRMDAAVEEQSRRGSAGRKRRKPDEEVLTQPQPTQYKDFTALTTPQHKIIEVTSGPVEQWLKTIPDLSRIVSRQVYGGAGWTFAKSKCLSDDSLGGVIILRFGGMMLGRGWKLRGEEGWDLSTHDIPKDGNALETSFARTEIWGTDVYTDDSDPALLLVHAGWLRWRLSGVGDEEGDKRNGDVVNVTVRIVPRLVRYTGVKRNGIQSRNWGNGHDGYSVVVEAVERVKAGPSLLEGKKNRKLRLAEFARERALLYPQQPLKVNEDVLNRPISPDEGTWKIDEIKDGEEDKNVSLVFGPLGIGFVYRPSALKGYLDYYQDPEDGETSLWTHDLLLWSEKDGYRLQLIPSSTLSSPRLNIIHTPRNSGSITIGTELAPTEFHWLPEGLAVRLDGSKGKLVIVESYNWVKRELEGQGKLPFALEIAPVVTPALTPTIDSAPVSMDQALSVPAVVSG